EPARGPAPGGAGHHLRARRGPDARASPERARAGERYDEPPRGPQRSARGQPRSVLSGAGVEPAGEWTDVEWRMPLTVRERQLGVMVARHVLPPGAKA